MCPVMGFTVTGHCFVLKDKKIKKCMELRHFAAADRICSERW